MTSFPQPSVSWWLILSCLSFCLPGQVAPAAVSDRAWLEDFNVLAEEIIQYHQPPGVAIAIVTPSQVLALKTYGVRQLGEEGNIDEDTVFRVASLSKCCTSALVAQLAAQGRIDIESPITYYLPDVQIASPEHT